MKGDAEMEPAPGWVVVGQAVVEFPQAIRVVIGLERRQDIVFMAIISEICDHPAADKQP
jgi:hypothetical protein